LPQKIRNDRTGMLRILSEKKRRYFYEANLDKVVRVLFENDIEAGNMHGFTENYIRVSAKYDPILINEIKNVKLVSINEAGLVEVSEVEQEILSH
jgi:threonylcarbamoyladenosine tRNA methylthiotransferase MtaB